MCVNPSKPYLGRIYGLQHNLPKALSDSHKVCGRDIGPIPDLFDGSLLLYVILCPSGPTLHPQQNMLQGLHDREIKFTKQRQRSLNSSVETSKTEVRIG